MKRTTSCYRFYFNLFIKSKLFSRKHCKTLASRVVNNKNNKKIFSWQRRTSLRSLLSGAFNWHTSIEGYNYWYRIHCKLNKGFNIHGEYIGISDKEIDAALLIPF